MIILEILIIGNILSIGINSYMTHRTFKHLQRIQFQEDINNKKEEVKLELMQLEFQKRYLKGPQIFEAEILL
jgi:hypothetical protein